MKEGRELYKRAELPAGANVEPCPVCGADAELWQYSKDFKNGPIDKVVMCTNGERFGPQDGAVNEGCLLYMPPQDFYRGRIAEAVKFWNEYARALVAQRTERQGGSFDKAVSQRTAFYGQETKESVSVSKDEQ